MDSNLIRRDISEFQSAVQKLSGEIGKASTLWSDSKYGELSSAVSVLANYSKEVIVLGDKCCASIEKYKKISEEHY